MATKSSVFKKLIKDLEARDRKGWQTYGRPMNPFDGRDTLQDIKEELLDAIVYITKLQMEK